MDFVPKDTRSRWKSLDSIASFGWCGSAALGGYLADKYDYSFTFMITAVLQGLGGVLLLLLLPLVPVDENFKEKERGYTALNDPGNYQVDQSKSPESLNNADSETGRAMKSAGSGGTSSLSDMEEPLIERV